MLPVLPQPGQIVLLRTRKHLVEEVTPHPGYGTTVRLACLDDDAQGMVTEVAWELELDRKILDGESWASIGSRGFDDPRYFAAFINALRWNCVTATDPSLFQAPFRAGIRIEAFQLEPLRKALRLPRVNVFIADGVGTGKTIMAGLIGVELLLRKRVNEIVIACPPSMIPQWRDEMESRFGLVFEVLDRAFIERIRVERGYGVNPWTTYPRFLVSHNLLIDETYAAPLRAWLDNLRPGSLLILDEAHHAAPSSGAKYAIDSRFTKSIRELAHRFEHRLFLSATPHNGHSNSFSALLELLDPQRFTRGVKVVRSNLDAVMVRRLKEDLREVSGGFPRREPVQIDISGLAPDAPELRLAVLLDQYRQVRDRRMEGETKRKQAQAALLISGLQQRLLSSAEAFARTLSVHRGTMERIWADEQGIGKSTREVNLRSVGADDELAEVSEQELFAAEVQAVEAATASTFGNSAKADARRERHLLDEMQQLANVARSQPDAKVRKLIDWIRGHMCLGVHLPGEPPPVSNAPWNDIRILIFTEWQDTKRYLSGLLNMAIAGTQLAERRIVEYHGGLGTDRREMIKKAFNEDPEREPLRILIATDAAREGLNLQARCHNLFHFDVPWNPSRLEQRNGRIDRKLQPAETVFCHYFVYTQRPEDRVLKALVRKTDTIRKELGSLSTVLEERLATMLDHGISRRDIERLESEIESTAADKDAQARVEEELEATRERQEALAKQIDVLRRHIGTAKEWLGFDTDHFRDALSCSLEMDSNGALASVGAPSDGPPTFALPAALAGNPQWADTLDMLRALPENGKKDFFWRREAPIRPVVFEAPQGIDDGVVQLHLEHRLAKRLLSRFLSQGFTSHDLSRACLAQSEDAIPRVVLLGRLALYGQGAARLHEEILTVTARWTDPVNRKGGLAPHGRDAEAKTLDILRRSIGPGHRRKLPDPVVKKLRDAIARDVEELVPHLESRGADARIEAEKLLADRGRIESEEMRKILVEQKQRVLAQLKKSGELLQGEFPEFAKEFADERRQLEADRRYWDKWLANVDGDLKVEPQRILDHYRTLSWRLEPVGLVYLWPVTG